MFSSLRKIAAATLALLPGRRARLEAAAHKAQMAFELERIRDMRAEFVLATMRLKELILAQPHGAETVAQLMTESALLAEIWAEDSETQSSPTAANDR